MKAAVVSFTRRGSALTRQAVEFFRKQGYECSGWVQERFYQGEEELCPMEDSLGEWCGRQFQTCTAILFIGACGIAVRACAPWIRDKFTDPAVLVMDEGSQFVIPILSGHMGGANRLAAELGTAFGALPVITTATDVNGKFAVDVLAADNHCAVSDRRLAKEISAAVLAGKTVELSSDFPVDGAFPPEVEQKETGEDCQIRITISDRQEEGVLRLIPRCLILGMGCRKGADPDQIRIQAENALKAAGADRRAVRCITSIDLKKEEEGLVRLAEEWKVPFFTFSGERLRELKGEFTSSEFVRSVTGVDCVCERAAAAVMEESGRGGIFLLRKQAGNGVTAAVAAETVIIHTGRT